MKHIIILSTILIGISIDIFSQIPRDVLAVPGTYSSSYDWHPEIDVMKNTDKYLIREAFSKIKDANGNYPYFDWKATIAENVNKLNFTVNNPVHNYTNVLGLGHDVGGLALRGLKEINSKVTGIILVGTPNRGSNLLRDLQSPEGDSSKIEKWLALLNSWKGGVECKDCDKTKHLIDFVRAFKNENYGKGAINDPNSYYNTLPNPDPNTTAIIWGNAGEQKLGTFLGSMGGINPSSFVDLEGCAKKLKEIREAHLKEKKLQQKIDRITGFFSIFTSFFSVTAKDTTNTIASIITKVGNFITTTTDVILKDIKTSKEINEEERNILICEIANQRLEAEWKLRVIGGTSQLKKSLVNGPNYNAQLCQEYSYQCQYNQNSPAGQTYCYYASLYCQQTINTLVADPTDLVFTKTEQTHPSVPANKTFELINVNHFQEQAYDNNRIKIKPLFDYTYGPYFHVPHI